MNTARCRHNVEAGNYCVKCGREIVTGPVVGSTNVPVIRQADAFPSPEWAVREYETLRDDYLALRVAIIEARRELWWFIENDEPNGEGAARAIRIQDEILGRALDAR